MTAVRLNREAAMTSPRLGAIVINAVDHDALVAFWSGLLGVGVARQTPGVDQPGQGVKRIAMRMSGLPGPLASGMTPTTSKPSRR